MGDPRTAAIVKNPDAITAVKWLVWIHLLSHGQRASITVETDFDLNALAAAHFLPDMGSRSGTQSGPADGGQGPTGTSADLIAKHTPGHST